MANTENAKRLALQLPRPRLHGWGAMLLVFVNGLILSIASYMLLNMFVQEMIDSNRATLQRDASQMVNDRVVKIKNDLDVLSLLVRIPENLSQVDGQLGALNKDSDRGLSFQAIYWFPMGMLREVDAQKIYPSRGDESVSLAPVLAEIVPIYNRLPNSSLQDVIMVPLGNQPPVRTHRNVEKKILRQSVHTLAFIQRIDNGITPGVLLALLPADRLLNGVWLDQRPYVERIRLLTSQGWRVVFDVHQVSSVDALEEDPVLHDSNYFIQQLNSWGGALRAQFIVKEDQQGFLLTRVPLLLLLFGLLVTVLGTLYVYNNQRQAVKLAGMNRALALKNMELNAQFSERERLFQTLRKTERENRAIIDSVTDIIFETDTKGILLFLNEAWCKITGFDAEKSKGHSLFDLLHPSEQEDQRAEYEALIRGQKTAYRFITRLRTADGKYRTVEIGFSMLRMDESRNLHVVGTITDVEERRRAEAALSEAERKFRTIWENAASGIYQITAEGQLLTANPTLARLFGYENSDEMMHEVKNVHRQLYANMKDRQGMIRDLMLNGQIRNIETEGVRKDGRRFWLLETARLVKDEDDNILYFEGNIDDISQRKEAEFLLRDAKLQSDLANRAKTEFLANMSHELRTPLNAIIGFSEIIKDQVFGKIEPAQYLDYATDINESGKHLLSIINTILDVSRIEAGERQLNEAVVSLRALTAGVINLLGPRADLNEQQINVTIPDDLPDLVCEELSVKQMLVNLLSNAIKFTPTGGRITISAEQDRNGDLRLAVTDTGIGLDAEEIDRVMAPFGQASGSFSRSSSGAGLGLTLVNSLIRLHGGRLEMFSQKGIGTTAAVVFPASRVRSV